MPVYVCLCFSHPSEHGVDGLCLDLVAPASAVTASTKRQAYSWRNYSLFLFPDFSTGQECIVTVRVGGLVLVLVEWPEFYVSM